MKLVIGNKNYSSWSLRPWYAMRHAGIEFEEVPLFFNSDFRERIHALSPTGRVPVLIDGDVRVWESLAIGEYLADRFPDRQLWPRDGSTRAWARAVATEMHAGFGALRDAMPMNCRAEGRRVDVDAAVRRDIDRVVAIWDECRTVFAAEGPWLFGRFTFADAMYAPVASRFRTYGVTLDGAPARYVATVLDNDTYRDWLQAARAETETVQEEEVG